jgi:hypothetical protein
LKIAQHFSAGLAADDSPEPVKRATARLRIAILDFSRPLSGLSLSRTFQPSDKSLGYYQKVRFADELFNKFYLEFFYRLRSG